MLLIFLPTLFYKFGQRRIVIRRVVHDILPKLGHESHFVLVGQLRESWKTFDDHDWKL